MPKNTQPLRLILIGAGKRTGELYLPIVNRLAGHVRVVGVWNRTAERARILAESLGVPHSTNLSSLVSETGAEAGIVSVNYDANGPVGLAAVRAGLHTLLETPIAHDLTEADAITAEADKRALKVEVAEQFHRRPLQQIILAMLATGRFGKVNTSVSDFAGHGYHGVSVMRSYLGFDAVPRTVTAIAHEYPLTPHPVAALGHEPLTSEKQEHAFVTFEDGQTGIFHWSDATYFSPTRSGWRAGRFYAERGMAVCAQRRHEWDTHVEMLDETGKEPLPVLIEQQLDTAGHLRSVTATPEGESTTLAKWDNPFVPENNGRGLLTPGPPFHDEQIGVAGCLMSLIDAVRESKDVTYGPKQARLDQAVSLAIAASAEAGGKSVPVP